MLWDNFYTGKRSYSGDIYSPTIFNLIINDICEILDSEVKRMRRENGTLDSLEEEFMCIFYADDGYTGSFRQEEVQGVTNLLVYLFKYMGLQTNREKLRP